MANRNAKKNVQRVAQGLDELGVEHDDESPDPEDLTPDRLWKEWQRLRKLESRISEQEDALGELEAGLEERQAALAQRESEIEALARGAEEAKGDVDRIREELVQRESELAQRERDLAGRELEAEAGFVAQNREQLRALERERQQVLREIEDSRREFREQAERRRRELQDELDSRRGRFEAELESVREMVERQREEVAEREAAVRRRESQLDQKQELLEVEKELWDEKRERELAARTADARAETKHYRNLLSSAERQRDELSRLVAELESNLTRLGEDPERVLRELDSLNEDNERLRDELAVRLTAAEADELRTRAADRDDIARELQESRRMRSELDAALRRQQIAVNDLEVVRDERDALEQQKETLRAAIKELKAQLGELRELDEATEPFPASSAIDRDSDLQRPVETLDEIDLLDLVEAVQGEMALREFHYRDLDIQLFVAGLATTRLHLLEGLSGTGKTSLPRLFAEVVGAEAPLVEVQAGWRDRDDLFGYFNAFEGRFYETEFTKALYKAGCPKWRDRPVLVVLDEMNLSHPEQYFAVMLSKLEVAHTGRTSIELVNKPLVNCPDRFIEGGKLPWPENVWFIGTANQDETTVGFADKTYDRAHVQELPVRHEPKQRPARWTWEPLSTEALHHAFDRAVRDHEYYGTKVAEVFRDHLAPAFARLQVGWGNRIDLQVRRFVPVAVGAGASHGAAADHILATKIVRKVTDRHDLPPEALSWLADQIRATWNEIDEAPPSITLESIDKEIVRLGRGFDLTEQ